MGAIGCHILDRARVGTMPVVHLSLNAIALGKQSDVFGRQVMHHGIETLPEGCAAYAGAWQDAVFNKSVQRSCNLKAMDLGACSHAREALLKRDG